MRLFERSYGRNRRPFVKCSNMDNANDLTIDPRPEHDREDAEIRDDQLVPLTEADLAHTTGGGFGRTAEV